MELNRKNRKLREDIVRELLDSDDFVELFFSDDPVEIVTNKEFNSFIKNICKERLYGDIESEINPDIEYYVHDYTTDKENYIYYLNLGEYREERIKELEPTLRNEEKSSLLYNSIKTESYEIFYSVNLDEVDFNYRDSKDDKTLLMLALEKRRVGFAKVLLERGASVLFDKKDEKQIFNKISENNAYLSLIYLWLCGAEVDRFEELNPESSEVCYTYYKIIEAQICEDIENAFMEYDRFTFKNPDSFISTVFGKVEEELDDETLYGETSIPIDNDVTLNNNNFFENSLSFFDKMESDMKGIIEENKTYKKE